MKKLLLITLLFCATAKADIDGPAAATATVLNTKSLRFTLFKGILAYMQAQAIYDIVRHYSYLQNLDTSNLKLTARQFRDLERFVARYYDIEKALNVQTPISVTCPPPAQQ